MGVDLNYSLLHLELEDLYRQHRSLDFKRMHRYSLSPI